MKEHETTFTNGDVRLTGTVCVPEGAGPFPFVVFVHGSGPLDRDENMPGQRLNVFNTLAHHFASKGMASFRYDKRGCGSSSGSFSEAGFTELVSDAKACVAAVCRLELCSQVFLVAHSEGCVLAPLVAQQLPQVVSGIVLLCPFLPPVEQLLIAQAEQLKRDVQALSPIPRFFFRLSLFGLRDPVASQQSLIARIRKSTTPTVRIAFRKFPAKWLRELLTIEAHAVFHEVACPTLLVGGQKDLQCDPADVDRIRRLLCGSVDAHVVPDLTHLLRFDSGEPSLLTAHKLLAMPVAPTVVELASEWLQRYTREPSNPALARRCAQSDAG